MRTANPNAIELAIIRVLNTIAQHDESVFDYWMSELSDASGMLRPDAVTADALAQLQQEEAAINLRLERERAGL